MPGPPSRPAESMPTPPTAPRVSAPPLGKRSDTTPSIVGQKKVLPRPYEVAATMMVTRAGGAQRIEADDGEDGAREEQTQRIDPVDDWPGEEAQDEHQEAV